MTTPISNNNSTLAGSNKSVRTDEKGPDQGRGQAHAEAPTVGGQADAVSVSRAAQVLNEQPLERGQGVIQSAEHAAEVAQGLRALFDGDAGQAVAAQAKNVSSDLIDLLKAS
ncbi:hypothetical protein ACFL2V_00650 [Pseudomonadota bacterium]